MKPQSYKCIYDGILNGKTCHTYPLANVIFNSCPAYVCLC